MQFTSMCEEREDDDKTIGYLACPRPFTRSHLNAASLFSITVVALPRSIEAPSHRHRQSPALAQLASLLRIEGPSKQSSLLLRQLLHASRSARANRRSGWPCVGGRCRFNRHSLPPHRRPPHCQIIPPPAEAA